MTPSRPRFIRPVFFIWIVVPAALWIAHAVLGLPHVIFSYEWTAPRHASYGDFRARHYTRCTYLGPYGAFTEHPRDGKCGWVRFVRPEGASR